MRMGFSSSICFAAQTFHRSRLRWISGRLVAVSYTSIPICTLVARSVFRYLEHGLVSLGTRNKALFCKLLSAFKLVSSGPFHDIEDSADNFQWYSARIRIRMSPDARTSPDQMPCAKHTTDRCTHIRFKLLCWTGLNRSRSASLLQVPGLRKSIGFPSTSLTAWFL